MDDPREGTIERWAWDYVRATSLEAKLAPPAPPSQSEEDPIARRLASPGRPRELVIVDRAEKVRGLRSPHGRARAMHAFFHHELQAAELMCWAILAFPHTPPEFRAGLARIAIDEVRHMNLYKRHIELLGRAIGDFPVRDWFWQRVPSCSSPASFVAVMGLGFESANLEHSAIFAARFRDAGDEEGASVQELVGKEEIAHVRFGARWFAAFEGELTFDRWRDALPPPLSPWLMKGSGDVARAARVRAGQPEPFIDALAAFEPVPFGA